MVTHVFTPKTNKLAREYGLSPNELAFIDLYFSGFDKRDAFIIAMNMGATWTDDAVERSANEIIRRDEAKHRLKDLRNPSTAQTYVDEQDISDKEIMDALSKDNMLKDLYFARTKTKRGSKEWLDINKMIADITRMKQEEVKSEDNTIHFYLPLTCHRCELYEKYADKNKK